LNPAHRRRISPRKGGKDHSMARTNPFQFLQQTRSEIAKVVWPTRREVALTSTMVFALAIVAALFFSLVDLAIRFGLTSTLNFFGS
jgi:preprotein translocase subunit SecE